MLAFLRATLLDGTFESDREAEPACSPDSGIIAGPI